MGLKIDVFKKNPAKKNFKKASQVKFFLEIIYK